MNREKRIESAIKSLGGFEFERFARKLLQREEYPHLNPLPEQNDQGQDARTEGIFELEDEMKNKKTVAISKDDTFSKVKQDCDRCIECGHDIDVFIFVTCHSVSGGKRSNWEKKIKEKYGWKLTIHDITWFKNRVTKPRHEKQVAEYLGIEPLGGDFLENIIQEFQKERTKTIQDIKETLPHIHTTIDREQVSIIINKLTHTENIIVTGEAGVGKSGILKKVVKQSPFQNILLLDARDFSEISNKSELAQQFNLNSSLSDAVEHLSLQETSLVVVDQLDNILGTPTEEVLINFLRDISDLEGVRTAIACRKYYFENHEQLKEMKNQKNFAAVKIDLLEKEIVKKILSELGIEHYSDQLITLGQNLLNLSIIAELKEGSEENQTPDFSSIRNEVQLWDKYRESLTIRERKAKWDKESGKKVAARAAELSERGLRRGSRTFPLGYDYVRADDRLRSRGVIQKVSKSLYRFRHDELQDYFYAWKAVKERRKSTDVSAEIGDKTGSGVLRWMLRIYSEDDRAIKNFLNEALSNKRLGFYPSTVILDEIKDWGPEKLEEATLELLFDKIEQREDILNYFFKDLKDPSWAEALHNQNRYEEPNGPALRYLVRISSQIPQLISEVISSTKTESERARALFLEASKNLSRDYVERNIDQFTSWLKVCKKRRLYEVQYIELVNHLASRGDIEVAFSLFKQAIESQRPLSLVDERRVDSRKTHRDNEAQSLLDSHSLKKLVEENTNDFLTASPERLVDTLEGNLKISLQLEKKATGRNLNGWPSSIDREFTTPQLKEVLFDGLKDALEQLGQLSEYDKFYRSLLNRYLTDENLMFQRLAFFIMSSKPKKTKSLVEREILKEQNYQVPGLRYELIELLKNSFSYLSSDTQDKALNIIEDLPRALTFQGDLEEEKVKEASENLQKAYLWVIRDELPTYYRKKLEKLIDQHGKPSEVELKGRPKYVTGITQKGPVDIESLQNSTPEEVFDLCEGWNPDSTATNKDLTTEISPRGLAKDIKDLIKDSPNEFAKSFWKLKGLESIYVRYAIDGIRESLEEGKGKLEWGPVLDFCQTVSEDPEKWTKSTRLKIGELIRKGLSQDENLVSEENIRTKLKEVILNLTKDPDPNVEPNKTPTSSGSQGFDNPLDKALNSGRPYALGILFQYSVIYAQVREFSGYLQEERSGLEGDVKSRLRGLMEDSAVSVKATFGEHLGQLFWLDKPFLQQEIDCLFPESDKESEEEKVKAVMRGFFQCRYKPTELFDLLKKKFFYVVDVFSSTEEEYARDVRLGLANLVFYCYFERDEKPDDPESLVNHIYQNIPQIARDVAWKIWKRGDKDSEFHQEWKKVKNLWSWRISEIQQADDPNLTEFEWFIEWLFIGEDHKDLENNYKIISDTIPYVSFEHRSWDTLTEYLKDESEKYPKKAIELYAKLLDQENKPNYLKFGKDSKQLIENCLETETARDPALDVAETIATQNNDFLKLIEEYRI